MSFIGESFGFESLGLVIGFTYIEMGSLGVMGVISSPWSCLAYCNFLLGGSVVQEKYKWIHFALYIFRN